VQGAEKKSVSRRDENSSRIFVVFTLHIALGLLIRDKMGFSCSRYGARNVRKILIRKLHIKRFLGRRVHRRKDKLAMDLKEVDYPCVHLIEFIQKRVQLQVFLIAQMKLWTLKYLDQLSN
jgi:hypothetical protein